MDLLLRRAAAAGLEHGVVIVREAIREAVERHVRALGAPIPIDYVVQDRPIGTAHALLATRGVVTGPFVVVNADDLYPADAITMLAHHLATADEHAMVAFRVGSTILGDQPVSRAAIAFGEDFRLRRITEEKVTPGSDLDSRRWVSMNLWGFQPRVFAAVQPKVEEFVASGRPGEVLLTDIVADMLRHDDTIRVLTCESPCVGITHPDDVVAVRRTLGLA